MDVRISKPWWKSSRTWWNLVTTILGVLTATGIIPPGVADALGPIGDIFNPEVLALANPVGNVLLNSVSDGAKLTLRRA